MNFFIARGCCLNIQLIIGLEISQQRLLELAFEGLSSEGQARVGLKPGPADFIVSTLQLIQPFSAFQ